MLTQYSHVARHFHTSNRKCERNLPLEFLFGVSVDMKSWNLEGCPAFLDRHLDILNGLLTSFYELEDQLCRRLHVSILYTYNVQFLGLVDAYRSNDPNLCRKWQNSLLSPIICSPTLASSTGRGSTDPTSRQPRILRQRMYQLITK